MQIHPFQAVYPNLDFITTPESFFETVKQDYYQYKKSGFFKKNETSAVYIYQIESPVKRFTGLIACSDILDYLEGKIKKHELTMSSQEQQQVDLMMSRQAMVKPVLLTYPAVNEINTLLDGYIREKSPFYRLPFNGEKTVHRFWQIEDPAIITQIQALFARKVPLCFIADGHHRVSGTALLYERKKGHPVQKRFRKVLAAFFPSDNLEIHEFDRVVEGLNGLSPAGFMAELSQVFEIEQAGKMTKPSSKHELILLIEGQWFRLRWKDEILESSRQNGLLIDASILNDMVIQKILGVKDIRNNDRIHYVGGPEGWDVLIRKATATKHRVAFLLYPVSIDEFMSLAMKGIMLPPKSTWFEPRIKNGLLVYEY